MFPFKLSFFKVLIRDAAKLLFLKNRTEVGLVTSAWRRSCSGRRAEAGTGVYECGERRREGGLTARRRDWGSWREDGGARARGGAGGGEGSMADRVASCGSLCDSTNLLLQYCNNGELSREHPRISLTVTMVTGRVLHFFFFLWEDKHFYFPISAFILKNSCNIHLIDSHQDEMTWHKYVSVSRLKYI